MSSKTSRATAMTLCVAATTGLSTAATLGQASAAPSFSSHVVAGYRTVTDAAGTVWKPAPERFVGANFTKVDRAISGTNSDVLYGQEAVNMSSYSVDVPYAGTYRVTLPMSETFYHAAGKRVFNVSVEGKRVLTNVDIYRTVGGDAAYTPSFTVKDTDGRLDLAFENVVDHAHVSGVQVEYLPGASTAADPSPTTTTPVPSSSATASPSPTPSTPAPAPAVKFAPNNIFHRDISAAPTASNSAAMVANLTKQVTDHWGGIAAVNSDQYNASFYRATPTTQKVDLAFNDCQNKGYTPYGLLNGKGIFKNVPIPADAVPANGTDGNLDVYDPVSDKLWEFWVASKDKAGRWSACWGGRIDDVSQNPGYFDGTFGTTATGISFSGSMITLAEARARQIDHAMYLAIMSPAKYTNYSWPAQRSDGFSTDPSAVPEGTRLRLDPRVNVNSLNLTPFGKAVAKAAQKYGFIVADKAGSVNVSLENGAAEKARTGVDPWSKIFSDAPNYQQLKNFPWAKLQALPKDYGRNR